MAKVNVSVKAPKVGKEATLQYDFGNDLDDAVKKFGAGVVFSNFVQNAIIVLQGAMRSRLQKGGDVAALATIWKPGVKLQAVAQDPKAAAIAAFANFSAEEKKKFLADLKAAG